MDNSEAKYTSHHRAWSMGYYASVKGESKSSCPVMLGQTGSGGADLFEAWNAGWDEKTRAKDWVGRSKRDLNPDRLETRRLTLTYECDGRLHEVCEDVLASVGDGSIRLEFARFAGKLGGVTVEVK